jgi:hypothetical protein
MDESTTPADPWQGKILWPVFQQHICDITFLFSFPLNRCQEMYSFLGLCVSYCWFLNQCVAFCLYATLSPLSYSSTWFLNLADPKGYQETECENQMPRLKWWSLGGGGWGKSQNMKTTLLVVSHSSMSLPSF